MRLAPYAARVAAPYAFSAEWIPGGDAGTERTLARMDRFMDRGAVQPEIIQIAQDVALRVAPRDEDGQALALLGWVRAHTHYVHDPRTRGGAELVKDPDRMLREISARGKAVGDCDDQVVLLGALLRAIGIESEPVVVSPDAGDYAHVLLRYRSPASGWVTLDPITRNSPGWFPMGTVRVGTFSNGRINPSAPQTVQGIGDLPEPLKERIDAAAKAVEPATTLMWFVLGAAAVWSWFRTGKAPL